MQVQCLACDHIATVANGDPPEHSILRCEECNARMSFGKLMPKIVVEPFHDETGRTWVRRRYINPRTKEVLFELDVDPQYAATEAKNVLSLVIP